MSETGPDHPAPPERLIRVVLVEHDPAWAGQYATEEQRIRTALGPVAREVHHAGSTSVPGLAAKPFLDVVLVVAVPVEEAAYVPALERVGFIMRRREPHWHEHRLLRRDAPRVNLHVFGVGCAEVRAMLAFRDHLRRDPADRELYERTKRALAARRWSRVQDYADAKSEVVAAIMARALPASPGDRAAPPASAPPDRP